MPLGYSLLSHPLRSKKPMTTIENFHVRSLDLKLTLTISMTPEINPHQGERDE
jgi:hypothetical protein